MNKTKSMLITTAQKRSRLEKKEIDLVLNGKKIENVCKQKLLGVHIDQHLSWDDQVDHVYKMINCKLALLSRIKKYLNLDTRILYFNAYIMPLFDYCITIWGNCSRQNIHRMTKLQKKTARIILNKSSDTPSKTLFEELKWLDFEKKDHLSKMHSNVQLFK